MVKVVRNKNTIFHLSVPITREYLTKSPTRMKKITRLKLHADKLPRQILPSAECSESLRRRTGRRGGEKGIGFTRFQFGEVVSDPIIDERPS